MQPDQNTRASAEAQDYIEIVPDESSCASVKCHIFGALVLAGVVVGIATMVVVLVTGT